MDLKAIITSANPTVPASVNMRMPWTWFGITTNASTRTEGKWCGNAAHTSWTIRPAGVNTI